MVVFRYGFKGLRLGIMLGLGLEIVRFSDHLGLGLGF